MKRASTLQHVDFQYITLLQASNMYCTHTLRVGVHSLLYKGRVKVCSCLYNQNVSQCQSETRVANGTRVTSPEEPTYFVYNTLVVEMEPPGVALRICHSYASDQHCSQADVFLLQQQDDMRTILANTVCFQLNRSPVLVTATNDILHLQLQWLR